MQACPGAARSSLGRGLAGPRIRRRALSSWSPHHHETVEVRCASSGNISLDLHGLPSHPPSSPLLIYLPPFSSSPTPGGAALLPSFLARHPTVVVNYRWSADPTPEAAAQLAIGRGDTPLHWPTPIHDTLFAYEWAKQNLAPQGSGRRDVYVFGSYLGASLAASLALTESHRHQRMAVRGVALYNGVYDWTRFLPDHPSNAVNGAPSAASPFQRRKHGKGAAGDAADRTSHEALSLAAANRPAAYSVEQEGSSFGHVRRLVPALFKTPSNLFDPFASPCLFFQNGGMLVPPSFEPSDLPPALLRAITELSLDEASIPAVGSAEAASLETTFKAPRKAHLVFPPRQSSLRLPETLLLHESAPRPLGGGRRPPRKRRAAGSSAGADGGCGIGSAGGSWANSFAVQASSLAGLMRRSVNMHELKARRLWDDDFDDYDGEAVRRIRLEDAGPPGRRSEEYVEEAVSNWLDDRVGQ